MAQVPTGGNYVVDNSTGANVRADINEIFDAILTVNSGSSGPSYAKAYTLWADTSDGTMKIRNGANNAWIELFQLDGTLTLEDGSESAPALGFRNDLNTGIFAGGADKFNITAGGVERLELGATTIFNETGADVDFRIEGDTEQNLFYVDAGNNRIGICDSTPSVSLDLTGAGGGNGEINVKRTSGSTCFIQAQASVAVFGSSSNHRVDFKSNGALAMTIDTSQRVGIGTSSPTQLLEINGASNPAVLIKDTTNNVISYIFAEDDHGTVGSASNHPFVFNINNGEVARFDTSGNLGINVSDPDQKLEVAGTAAATDLMVGRSGSQFPVIQRHTASSGSQNLTICGGSGLSTNASSEPTINDTTEGAAIRLSAGDPTSDTFGGGIQYIANGSTSPNNPGKGNQHVFLVRTAANTLTEKMRLDHLGGLRINTTSTVLDAEKFSITELGTTNNIGGFRVNNQSNTKVMINMAHVANSDDRKFFKFMRTGSLTEIGSINTNPTTTAFNTSSDYRLKENEVLISDGITRLKTLKPYRFNFKIEPDKTVDGFFAHEVTPVIPEAVTGEKDAVETTYYTNGDTIPEGKAVGDVKEENVILPQSLDYAKFTPLLTAALQEAISKIEVLETKVAALEAA